MFGGGGDDTYIASGNQALTVIDTAGDDAIVARGIGLTKPTSFFALVEDVHIIAYDAASEQQIAIFNWLVPQNSIETITLAEGTFGLQEILPQLLVAPGYLGNLSANDLAINGRLPVGTTNSDLLEFVGHYQRIDVSPITLYGTSGADTLSLSGAADRVFAGSGFDTINGNAGADIIYGNREDDQLFGGSDNDILYGGKDNDLIDGQAEADVLYGNLHEDNLFGGIAADTLFGGQGDDTLNGGEGDDFLFGNRGDDRLIGNQGSDSFVFNFGAPSGRDTIADFTAGQDTVSIVGTTADDLSITFDAGNQSTTIRSFQVFEQVQIFPDGTVIVDGVYANEIIILGGDYTSSLGVSILIS